ncbi:Uncharacterized protein DAT39_013767 [Clarias magur]|uniref:Uncharacterized protein n=1 Tax=Clarias magur TaxID=1594786 RepID=A0A8J4U1D7_CLAMG|nr:Uncharacterized protein DAT39_013767 [Clarias magur]
MVSTKHEKTQSDQSAGLFDVVKKLSDDVRALKLEVSQLGRHCTHSVHYRSPHVDFARHKYDPAVEQRPERGRERYRRSPSVSPERAIYSSAPSYYRSNRSHSDHLNPRYSPDRSNRHYSPTSTYSPSHQREYYSSSSRDRFHHYSPDGRRSPDHSRDRYTHQHDSSRYTSSQPYDRHRSSYDSHQAHSARERHLIPKDRSHHMTVLAKVQPAVGVPDLEADYIGVLEPDPPSYPGLLVARTLAPVQAGLTYVRVMNPTTAVLQLPCDTRLGDFHPLGRDTDDDYCLVEPSVATVTSTVESSTHQSILLLSRDNNLRLY